MGVSTAYHLARLGVGPVIVLERDTVCSGSTALASGGIRHQYANRLGVELTTHSIATYATAIAARARDLGVVIKQQHEVHGFLREGDRVLGVTTASGSFAARDTVIATGAWSGVVGRLAHVDIPVRPHRRHKFMTAPFPTARIPAATPFIIDPHTNFSLRPERPGPLIGHGRRAAPDASSIEIDRSLEPALIERAIHRAPALADAELMRAWAGLYEMTPDQTGIVSAVPG